MNNKRISACLILTTSLALIPTGVQGQAISTSPSSVQMSLVRHTTTPTTLTLQHYANKKEQLNRKELKHMLSLVGFKGQQLKEAWAIAMRESEGKPTALNKNRHTGDNSYGIFQINMIDNLGPARREKFSLKNNEELFNPVKNAKIAYHMSQGGKNWSSWHGMNTDAQKWLRYFPN